ncbi:hypothetical protein HMPREF3159_01135 [Brachybacterium sp. HMSC06H03]|uniref:DUF3027 domain-containing protein n=1 Tax=Brachybacterium sp. HMSC06H03 TaxID=1581127 RepID=UPI0008A4AE85|nr:DUF3027 domain-containing protein [Brachybacterium sp. HMSC06H03]OFT65326.1 hypothetical protein HMPREF3159_01135 [Brachybacterium sp. HMSC06H03]
MTSPTTAPRRPRTARPTLDAVAAAAVELAREALEDVTEPGQVGEHLRVEATGERLVTHVFECTMPGYRGWSWVVVLARASRAKAATVAETALLPGEDAILAPAWEPWSERLKPEDVGADDLLPYREQDERLEQGYEATGDEDEDRVALWELGLGRPRVLSQEGRGEAAERWQAGEFGPRQTSSRGRKGTVPASCTSCGFLMKLSGSLRSEFGVCTNEWSPADGRVVHLGYGCGAHSETGQDDGEPEIPRGAGVIVDELDVEVVDDEKAAADATAPADGAGAEGSQAEDAAQTGGSHAESSSAPADVALVEPAAEPAPADAASAEPAAEPAPVQEPEQVSQEQTPTEHPALSFDIPEADSPED